MDFCYIVIKNLGLRTDTDLPAASWVVFRSQQANKTHWLSDHSMLVT